MAFYRMQKNSDSTRPRTHRAPNREEQRYLRQVGIRISNTRDGLGLTQYALAKQVGISRNTLMLIETAQTNTTLLMIRKIAASLGVPIGTLVNAE